MGRPHVEHRWTDDGAELKYCGKCDRWRELPSFTRQSHRWDGLNPNCRDCTAATRAAWHSKNPTKTAEYSRRYHERHPEKTRASKAAYRATERGKRVQREYDAVRYYADVDKGRARTAAWRVANPEKARKYSSRGKYTQDPEKYREARAAWRERNRERDRANLLAWREKNLDLVRQSAIRMAHKRRALKQELPNEPWTERQIIDRDGPECWMCGKPIGAVLPNGRRDWHVDHLIPLAKEYPDHPGDTLANLAVACASCNQWKNAKILPDAIARYKANLMRSEMTA